MSSSSLEKLKVALVYDRANTTYGGAEQVLLSLKSLFPKAVLFSSLYNPKKAKWALSFAEVRSSFLNKIPFAKNHHQWFVLLMPLAFESLDLSEFDVIISVTSAEAKGVITLPHQLHLCYLLTPPRYLYQFQEEYLKTRPLLRLPLLRLLGALLLKYLKWWDQVAIHRPDVIIPLSQAVKERAKQSYVIETNEPIYPPIDAITLETNDQALAKFDLPSNFNLIVSRLVFYKKIDLAIQTCVATNQNLVIVGSGQQEKRLKKMAAQLTLNTNSQIIFLGSQPQPVVNSLMNAAQLFLAPGVDDFGLSPLQANLFETPAIINASSGVAEVFEKYGFGSMITQANLAELTQKIQQSSFDIKKSANIGHVKRELGQEAFISKLMSVIDKAIINQQDINQ